MKHLITLLVLTLICSCTSSASLWRQRRLLFRQPVRQRHHVGLDLCSASLTESIPEGVIYPQGSPNHISTFLAWCMLLDLARDNVSIASFYWSMLREDVYNSTSAYQGEFVFRSLLNASEKLNVSIVTSGANVTDNDLDQLIAAGATVSYLDVARLLQSGVQHAKLWSVDDRHGYLGSANMDWRSLTQVKEMGIVLYDCPALVSDLSKIIGAFRVASEPDTVLPIHWSSKLKTRYNRTNPMRLLLNGIPASVYLTMSPPPFKPPGREDDLEAILHVIGEARSFIYVSVMEFEAAIRTYSEAPEKYWPILTNALVQASMEHGVEVRILVSRWRHTSPKMHNYMRSLRALNGVNNAHLRIRFFVVPTSTPEQESIPFSRVNHNKYMVTDRTLYIGTSNWSGDYFLNTGGAGIVINYEDDTIGSSGEATLRRQLQDIFHRDWNSAYTDEL
uniref:PLD phosphodiesterase domain-containing protein n=2 Tax=Mesocestoides corti TaxID=53468 RepID=A0A5K3FU71_MESCO